MKFHKNIEEVEYINSIKNNLESLCDVWLILFNLLIIRSKHLSGNFEKKLKLNELNLNSNTY